MRVGGEDGHLLAEGLNVGLPQLWGRAAQLQALDCNGQGRGARLREEACEDLLCILEPEPVGVVVEGGRPPQAEESCA